MPNGTILDLYAPGAIPLTASTRASCSVSGSKTSKPPQPSSPPQDASSSAKSLASKNEVRIPPLPRPRRPCLRHQRAEVGHPPVSPRSSANPVHRHRCTHLADVRLPCATATKHATTAQNLHQVRQNRLELKLKISGIEARKCRLGEVTSHATVARSSNGTT